MFQLQLQMTDTGRKSQQQNTGDTKLMCRTETGRRSSMVTLRATGANTRKLDEAERSLR
jgi:hypothetical protein